MEISIISSEDDEKTKVWEHFLLKYFEINCKIIDSNNNQKDIKAVLDKKNFKLSFDENIKYLELTIKADYSFQGENFNLIKIVQKFEVQKEASEIKLLPLTWIKAANTQYKHNRTGIDPLLTIDLQNKIYLNIDFVDITTLFNKIHAATPWFSILELLKGTNRSIKVLAHLKGHPFIWYIVIPETVFSESDLQPNILIYPADYGGIYYTSDSISGITSSNHNTSIENVQCGGETLFSFLTKPLSEQDYFNKLEQYLQLSSRYKNLSGRKPPPLHHFRKVINYSIQSNTLTPRYWDIPFGFETALSEKKNILVIPQLNGGDGALVLKNGLKKKIDNALITIYSQQNIFVNSFIKINKLILTAYSESGGNIFTSADNNINDIKALILFEPQYMNRHLKGENRSLVLGKTVIPKLIIAGTKVIIVGRHKKGWENKYLPEGVDKNKIGILPENVDYFIIDYPNPQIPYNPTGSPILKYRYSRLLESKNDIVIKELLSGSAGDKDPDSAIKEEKIEKLIEIYRSKGFNDEKIIKTVFTENYNADSSGGYFTHNFIVSCGKIDKTFFHEALDKIG